MQGGSGRDARLFCGGFCGLALAFGGLGVGGRLVGRRRGVIITALPDRNRNDLGRVYEFRRQRLRLADCRHHAIGR